MEVLVGEKIIALFVDKDSQDELVFQTEKGYTVFTTYGDCCSETWFADIIGVRALLGHVVTSVEWLEMSESEQDDRCRQESDQFYGVKLKTARGYIDIVYRNSSNGYYGGDIDKGSFVSSINPDRYEQITDDWAA